MRTKNMLDLSNCTFLIPVRLDFQERLENLDFVLKFINSNFKTNIYLYEESLRPSFHFFKDSVTKYKFFCSTNEYFHRTKIMNNMIQDSNTQIIVNYDSDIILDINSYIDSYNKIMNENIDMIFPYEKFWNVDNTQTKKIINNLLEINSIQINFCKKRRNNSVGGCIFFNRESYIKGGMENENFKAWGAEDDERYSRFLKLGFKVLRLKNYNLYHLNHPRGINSQMHTSYYKENLKELEKINRMNKAQLQEYVNTWKKI